MFTLITWSLAFQCRGEFEKSRHLAALARREAKDPRPPDRASVWGLLAITPLTDVMLVWLVCDTLGVSKRALLEAIVHGGAMAVSVTMVLMTIVFVLGSTMLPLVKEINAEINRSA